MEALSEPERSLPSWTFLTNHAHVMLAIATNPELRQRDIAYAVGLTVGGVQRILTELEHEGYVRVERVGRRNRYHVVIDKPLRHPMESDHTVGELIATLTG